MFNREPSGATKRPVHYRTDATRGLLHRGHVIFAGMTEQCVSQLPPIINGKTKTHEKPRLAAAGGMSRIEQVMGDLLCRHGRGLRIG